MEVKMGFVEVLAGSKKHPTTTNEIVSALGKEIAPRVIANMSITVIDNGRYSIVCHLDYEQAVRRVLHAAHIKIRERENV